MLQDLSVSESVEIKAGAEKVWEVLTNPALIKEYLFGTETKTNWQPGSEIIFQGEYNGTNYKDKGIILENIEHKKLSYSYWSAFSGTEDKPENYSAITYDLHDLGKNKTQFTWTQKGYATEEGYNHSKNGMNAFLQEIKHIAER